MSEHSTLIIAKNVKLIREALGLSQKDFAILSSISRASLIKMEAGNSNYNIKLLHSILSFAQFDLAEISKSNFKIFDGYRDKLIKMYFKDLSKRIILENQPTLVYCIKFYLLKTNFLDRPKEIREITTFFRSKSWYFSGNSIQIALKRMPDLIEIRKHESKGNTNVYLKK
jgi:transcriptional regulator with XRE-family HTH domain